MRSTPEHVPITYRRLAAQHLEAIRGTEMAPPGMKEARIVGEMCPMYRPDVDGVAYWEFQVETSPGNGPAGFVIVSAGEHDVPVPHWSLQRPPVSRELEERAAESGKRVARIYKLDALAYLAEDEAGEEVARSGQLPVPLTVARDTNGSVMGSLMAMPEGGADDHPESIRFKVEQAGPKPPDEMPPQPESWARLKERYTDSFGPFLSALRRRAEHPWKIHQLIAEFGEGVMAGDEVRLALLDADADVEVSGDGAPLVELDTRGKSGRAPKVRMKTRRPPKKEETGFEVHLRYRNGEEETLRYFLVTPDTPSKHHKQGRHQEEAS